MTSHIIQISSAMNGEENIIWGLDMQGRMYCWYWNAGANAYYWKEFPNTPPSADQ